MGIVLASLPAQAAPAERQAIKSAKEKVTAVAAKDPETTSSIRTNMDDEPNCASTRMRLFVESEGWIVRRVTTCY